MEDVKGAPAHPIASLPTRFQTHVIAISGLPGAGATTATRLLMSGFDAVPMSISAYPRMQLAAKGGVKGIGPTAEQMLCDFRVQGEAKDPLIWIRPFHRRLSRVINRRRPQRMVVTGVLTRRELFYCRALGACLIHLTAPEAVRRQRMGLRFPTGPVPALDTLDKLGHADPRIWDQILDTDIPYAEFVQSIRLIAQRAFR